MIATVNHTVVRSLKDRWRPSTVLSVALALSVGQLAAGPLVKQVRSADRQPPIAGIATGSTKSPNEQGATGGNSSLDELDNALADGRAKLEELDRVLSKVTALGQELAVVRDENQRLSARVDQLMADAGSNVAKARRLEEELEDTQESLAIASDARSKAEAGAAHLQMALDGMSSEATLLREQLTVIAERLNKTEGALVLLEQERKELIDQLRVRQADADRLEDQLASARQELAEREAANSGLKDRLASFDMAAAEATDAATQTLHAVEAQLASLNSVLSTGEGEGSTKAVTARTDQDGEAEPTSSGRPNRPITETDLRNLAPAAGPDQATTNRSEMLMLPGRAMKPEARIAAKLSIEHQIQAENLLLDLEAQPDSEGIKVIVPGTELFESNSAAVQDAAHARLAQVAELLQLYEQRRVLVLGHTDAVGDQKANMELSERRAEAVKQFFINHFDVEASRLSSRGQGENLPIASNATAKGREANRRVEVLILN